MNRFSLRQIANFVAFAITMAITFGGLPTTNNTQAIDQISERTNAALVLPADFTFFIIWGIIYFGLGAFVTYQLRPDQRDNPIIERIGWWFVANMAINSAWIFATQAENFALSGVLLFGIFATLLVIAIRAGFGVRAMQALDRWLIQVPFSLYLAWLSVALIVTLSEALLDAGWNGFGLSAETWTVIMMAVASALALVMLWTRRSVPFVLVVMWAIFGIASARQEEGYAAIVTGAFILEVVLLVGLAVWTLNGRRSSPALQTRTT